MKNLWVIVGLAIILLIVLLNIFLPGGKKQTLKSTEKPIVSNPYLTKYAGGYTVEVSSMPPDAQVEAYILHKSGKAKWMLLTNDGRGNAKIKSEKTGQWTAEENKIMITIQGNTGDLSEDFVYKNGRFVDTLTGERYLKKTE